MADKDDDLDLAALFAGLSNSVGTSGKGITAAECLAALEAFDLAERSQPPHPVKVTLIERDYQKLLDSHGVHAAWDGACHPVAVLFGIPVFYGERSEIEYSDGSVRPL